MQFRTTLRNIEGNSKEDHLNAILEEFREYEGNREDVMIPRLLLSIDRRMTTETATEIVDLAIRYYGKNK